MRQLENVGETLVSSYFSDKEILTEKFGSDLTSENPFWEDVRHQAVASLSDICIKVNRLNLITSKNQSQSVHLMQF